jgi:hypothetical protein
MSEKDLKIKDIRVDFIFDKKVGECIKMVKFFLK